MFARSIARTATASTSRAAASASSAAASLPATVRRSFASSSLLRNPDGKTEAERKAEYDAHRVYVRCPALVLSAACTRRLIMLLSCYPFFPLTPTFLAFGSDLRLPTECKDARWQGCHHPLRLYCQGDWRRSWPPDRSVPESKHEPSDAGSATAGWLRARAERVGEMSALTVLRRTLQ